MTPIPWSESPNAHRAPAKGRPEFFFVIVMRESQASRAGLPANLRHCGRLVSPRVIEAAQLEADWLQHFREISVGTLSSQTAPTNHARRVGDKPPTCEFVIDGVAEREQRAFGRTHEVGTVERARAGVQRRGSDSN